ncbi:MAG TPA: hypothetical protein VFO25_02495 [Candidatus Eremiobacteraceae bacterium]|nr:hypothetical protein [Candidatus Eremiobacteraceae bacterium]
MDFSPPLWFPDLAFATFRPALPPKFKCVERAGSRVRFEADHLFVNIYIGQISHVISIEFGRLSEPGAVFDTQHLLEYTSALTGRATTLRGAFGEAEAQAVLDLQRSYFDKYGGRIVADDTDFVERISKAEAAKKMTSFRDQSLDQALLFAKSYWKKGELFRALFFLAPYREELTEPLKMFFELAFSSLTAEQRDTISSWR